MNFDEEVITKNKVNYNYNSASIIKYLRKVLNVINSEYVDNGMRVAFIMKRYLEKYKDLIDTPIKSESIVLLCLLKDIGCFYQDHEIASDDYATIAASSYAFLKHCSPLKENAKPLFYCNARYIPDVDDIYYNLGMLIALINKVVLYVYEEYTLEEIEGFLRKDTSGRVNPKHVKRMLRLLNDEEDILEKLNQKQSLYVHEVSVFIQNASYTDEELLEFIGTTTFAFEFHNHETLAHTITTAVIARELARLCRLTPNEINVVYLAGLVHDIGKIMVPIRILCSPGKLEGDDLKEMRNHVVYTKQIIEGCFSYKIVEVASNHHERLDGTGYPRGLTGIDLSVWDKILSVADVTSALYCKRSYKKAFSDEQIVDIVREEAEDGKIDKRVVRHLFDNYEEIMALAKEKEELVLEKYDSMRHEFDRIISSNEFKNLFVVNTIEE